jgi:Arc/MetJ-type ribon-helix-helix transcriptional regulator
VRAKGLLKMPSINDVVRVKKTVTLPKDVIKWLEREIEERRFSNISHGIEYALYQLMKTEKRKE